MRDEFTEFKRQQREAWGASIGYHRLSEHFQVAIDQLIAGLDIQPGERVLDVATGTGRAAIAARARGAAVTAQDLSPILLSEAEHNARSQGYDDLRFNESDVENLPFPDASFDVVVSTFGVIHAPRPTVAMGELSRVLVGGGRLGLAVWSPDAGLPELRQALAPFNSLEPRAVDPSEWGSHARLREFLGRREFSRFETREGQLTLSYPDPSAAWRDWVRNYDPFRTAFAALPPANQQAVTRAAENYFARYAPGNGPVTWPLRYLLIKVEKNPITRRLG